MKTKLLFLLFLASLSTYAQYTPIPDVNFENELIRQGIDTGTPDGRVLIANVSSLISLNVSSSNITDLTGIEAFTDLEILNCYDNKLTVLNVSQNSYLSTFNCSTNLITNLNVSNNTDLKYFLCSNNKLTSLDVSSNTKLKQLQCINNLLTSLNTTGAAVLDELSCDKNQLTSLGLSTNTVLKTLSFPKNQLVGIDLSQNIKLTSLTCWDNKLTILEVDKNIDLVSLYCDSNKITSLDLSKNSALVDFSCSSNNLNSLNLKNANNTILNKTMLDLRSNPDLTCIQVDDADYSNTNWYTASKDGTASYSNACVAIQYTLIPDLNFENKLIALGIDSAPADGKVATNNIDKLISLDVSSSSIVDLTGIQDFVALKELNCGRNQLINLNVTKNVALTDLYCFYNQIKSIDVSQNSKLVSFMCHFNELTAIDVSNNPKLEMFDCLNNKITSLDISKNPLITELACENNQLTYLNLKNGANTILDLTFSNFVNNPNLTCIQVDDVTYSNTKWGTKKDATATFNTDCTPYTLIPDPNFENKLIALGIDSGVADGKVLTNSINTLTDLNVSNSSIANLTGIQDFVALQSLNCRRNNLTTLDLSKNEKLTYVDCSANKLTNFINTSNLDLKHLHCISNQLTSLDVTKYTALTNLSFSLNKITAIGLSKNTALTSLSCGSNLLTSLDVSTNLALTSLSCKSNQLTTLDVSKNTALTFLSCGYNLLTSLDVSSNTLLVSLWCDSNLLTELNITNNTSLTSLNCAINQLTNLNVTKNVDLYYFFCYNNQITSLDVSNKPKLELFYCLNNKITSLDISKNPLITELACENNQLTYLNLKNGANTILDLTYCNFLNNPDLKCIQVDDVDYSNANWTNIKDAAATYSVTCNTLGMEKSIFDKIAIYPNPTKGELHIDNIVLEKATVYDALGKIIKTTTFTSGANDNTLHLAGLPKGIYYLFLESEGANTAKKIIVE
jgi:Leucine-rich repeat (LRR) protein